MYSIYVEGGIEVAVGADDVEVLTLGDLIQQDDPVDGVADGLVLAGGIADGGAASGGVVDSVGRGDDVELGEYVDDEFIREKMFRGDVLVRPLKYGVALLAQFAGERPDVAVFFIRLHEGRQTNNEFRFLEPLERVL